MRVVHDLRRRALKRLLAGALAGFGAVGIACAQAQAVAAPFPARPVTLVSPFAAGGTSDTIARAVARSLEAELRQPVSVTNRPGAGGTVGVGSVLAEPADGHTLVLGGLGSVVFAAVVHERRIRFDPAKDLAPVGMVGSVPTLIVVRSDLPARTLGELVQLAKAYPRRYSYASAGVGGTLHVAGALLEREAGILLAHIPYRGGAPAMTDLAAGSVDIALADLALVQPFLQSGRVRPLALAGAQRSPLLPNVPTTAEAGLPGVRMDTWYAVFASATTPPAVLDALRSALERARADPALLQALRSHGVVPATAGTAQFDRQLKKDFDTWLPLLRRICKDGGCE